MALTIVILSLVPLTVVAFGLAAWAQTRNWTDADWEHAYRFDYAIREADRTR
jgi:hypothetical protein